jgi:hypothetical protein
MGRRVAGLMALTAGIVLGGPGAARAGNGEAPYRRLAGEVALSVRAAVEGVRRMLAEEGCVRILDEFQDQSGRPLRAALDDLSLTPEEYLERIFFYDAEGLGHCRRTHVLAMTTPGSRVVLVCGARFVAARRHDPRLTEVVLIHETLHTLGLGENPPTTGEITSRVFARCGP